MAQAWLNKYLTMKPEVSKIFDDLEAYLDWCKWEMQPFNQADLYRKNSSIYSAYLSSKRPKKPFQPRTGKRRNEQNISS